MALATWWSSPHRYLQRRAKSRFAREASQYLTRLSLTSALSLAEDLHKVSDVSSKVQWRQVGEWRWAPSHHLVPQATISVSFMDGPIHPLVSSVLGGSQRV